MDFFRQNRILFAGLGVVIVAGLVFLAFARNTGATGIHSEWVPKSTEWSGVCEADVPACNQSSEGTESGVRKDECKLLSGAGSFPCVPGQKRTVNVTRSCEVQGETCQEEGSCSEACGQEATEVPDGQGGMKVCEATPVCEEPSCEELQNCPEEPPVDTPVKEKKKSDGNSCEDPGKIRGFRFMQMNGETRLRWNEKDDVSKVDIRVFESDLTTFVENIRTADDGEYFYPSLTKWFRIRAVDPQCGLGPWSKIIN